MGGGGRESNVDLLSNEALSVTHAAVMLPARFLKSDMSVLEFG